MDGRYMIASQMLMVKSSGGHRDFTKILFYYMYKKRLRKRISVKVVKIPQ